MKQLISYAFRNFQAYEMWTLKVNIYKVFDRLLKCLPLKLVIFIHCIDQFCRAMKLTNEDALYCPISALFQKQKYVRQSDL